MINLIKYELLKKWKISLIFLVLTFLVNFVLYAKYDDENIIKAVPVFLILLISGFFILYTVDIVMLYSKDINKKTGYMLFLTPHSGYKILGSKLITAIIEGLTFIAIYFAMVYVNFKMILPKMPYNEFITFENFNINLAAFDIKFLNIFILILIIFAVNISFILTIYAAITIRKTLLSNVKFGGFLSLITFLILNTVISKISTWILNMGHSNSIDYNQTLITETATFLSQAIPQLLVPTGFCLLLFLASGYLLENKVNL